MRGGLIIPIITTQMSRKELTILQSQCFLRKLLQTSHLMSRMKRFQRLKPMEKLFLKSKFKQFPRYNRKNLQELANHLLLKDIIHLQKNSLQRDQMQTLLRNYKIKPINLLLIKLSQRKHHWSKMTL
jgi:Mg2+/Co2+ transporter CorC